MATAAPCLPLICFSFRKSESSRFGHHCECTGCTQAVCGRSTRTLPWLQVAGLTPVSGAEERVTHSCHWGGGRGGSGGSGTSGRCSQEPLLLGWGLDAQVVFSTRNLSFVSCHQLGTALGAGPGPKEVSGLFQLGKWPGSSDWRAGGGEGG